MFQNSLLEYGCRESDRLSRLPMYLLQPDITHPTTLAIDTGKGRLNEARKTLLNQKEL